MDERVRRDAGFDRAGAPGRVGRGRQTRRRVRRRGATGGAVAGRPSRSVRQDPHRAAPRGRAQGGDGDDHAAPPHQAARRRARVRRRDRHPLPGGRRRVVQRQAGRPVRVVVGQAGECQGVGARARHRPVRIVRVLRLHLRRPVARRGRQPGRGEPRPAAAGGGDREAVADPVVRGAARHAHLPCGQPRGPAVGDDADAARDLPLRPVRDQRSGEHPRRGPGHSGRQPPQLLRHGHDGGGDGAHRPRGKLPRQTRTVRRALARPGASDARWGAGRPRQA